MQIESIRFGKLEIDEKKIVVFDQGIPGLEQCRRFALLQYNDSYPIIWLQSVDDRDICLPVLDTFAVLNDYAFDIADSDVKELQLNGPEELHVVSVLVIPDSLNEMTVNLAAPVIINITTGRAKQIILGSSDYGVRVPVFQNICAMIREEEANAGTVTKAE